ncbi:hypothetical protein IMX13_04470 [Stenotrophomonas sp. B2]|nr:hypothetical protein [Stenotrophomonas sp. B2]
MAERRRISMLELDRHLSRSLEQARHAPLCVQRYGHPWVWVLSSDAWADAARWAALDVEAHPLLALRRATDAQLPAWPEAAIATLPLDMDDVRMLQRAVLLLWVQALDSAQRVHDDLRHHQVYRRFVGFGRGSAWSPTQCVRILQASRHPLLRRCVESALAAVPATLLQSAAVPPAGASADRVEQQRIAGGCLSY